MFWKEDEPATDEFKVSQDVVDVIYAIQCRAVPLDHAHALSESIHTALPWFADEPDAGLHLIHISEAGNGWFRPDNPDTDELLLSHRTKLTLRLPKHRLDQAAKLTGLELDIAGNKMTIGKYKTRSLSSVSTQFSRYVQTRILTTRNNFLNISPLNWKRCWTQTSARSCAARHTH